MRRGPSPVTLFWFCIGCLTAGCCQKEKESPPLPEQPARDFHKENVERWKKELQQAGGSWEAWEEEVSPFLQGVRSALEARPEQIAGIIGTDGWLFFRRSLEVLVSGNLRDQEGDKNPFPAIVEYHKQLKSRGVDMLFCPIPVKAAVFPEKISSNPPEGKDLYVNVYTRRLMMDLAEAGVECVDLLPLFRQQRNYPADPDSPYYMKQDTHWSHPCMRDAAHLFAERIKAYPWYRDVAAGRIEYSTREATCKRRGDIVNMLPDRERLKYPPMELKAQQVVKPDGSFYQDDESSPIILLGDSYAGVFHFEDCKHGGLSAHIALETGIPVDLILSQGMGPNVRGNLARRGEGALKGKRLVIWTLSERDLFNFHRGWKLIPVP